jgi:stage II sporulation protein P
MLRYRMQSKPRRWGWVVAVLVICLLLILISSRGAQDTGVSSQPASTENGITFALLQFWSNLKAGGMSLLADLTGHGEPGQRVISLDGQTADGSGDDEEDTASGDIQVVVTSPQTPDAFVPAGSSPQILIYHTHSYESYEKQDGQDYLETAQWRTKDNEYNIAAVGEALAKELSSKYGIATLHDPTDNECSQLGTAYSRSLKTVQKDMAANPGLKILIDLHRDADNAGIDPKTVTIDGKQVARVMLVIGTGTGQTGVGFTEKPDWQKNLQLAQAITDKLNTFDPQLGRKVDVKTGRYNQHVSTGAILVEIGHNKNTLQEALNAVPYVAQAIAEVFDEMNGPPAGPATASAVSPSPTSSPSPSPSPTAPASPSPAVLPSPTPMQGAPDLKVITLG